MGETKQQERAQALALREREATLSAIGSLPAEMRAALQLRKQLAAASADLAKTSWGQNLEGTTRKAVAQWGHEFGVDVATEVEVLGGNIYLNAAFYLRKLAEMQAAGLIEYAVADHIGPDERLTALAAAGSEDAKAELERRTTEQIIHNCPPPGKLDQCVAAVVFRVKLRNMDREVTGAKWTGDRRNNAGKRTDPVGYEFPVETAESRAARRCLRRIVSHLPNKWGSTLHRMEEAIVPLEVMIQEDHADLRRTGTVEDEQAHRFRTPEGFAITAGGSKAPSVIPPEQREEPYGEPEPQEKVEVEVTQEQDTIEDQRQRDLLIDQQLAEEG